MAGSLIIGAVGGLASSAIGSYVSTLLSPSLAALGYKVWADQPILLPEPSLVINAWQRGLLGEVNGQGARNAEIALRPLGIDVNGSTQSGKLWQRAVDAALDSPGAADIVGGWLRGTVSDDKYVDLLTRSGTKSKLWEPLYESMRSQLSPAMLDIARNRDIVTADEYTKLLRQYGGYSDSTLSLIDKLREQIPPISDILRFSHKEAFQPEVANELRYYDEYPSYAEKWMRANGVYGGPGFKIKRDGQEVEATWLDLYNAAEWQPPSPTQVYTFQQRIRENNIQRFRQRWPDVVPWSDKQTNQWLRIADYPPGVRDYLSIVSYRTLDKIALARAWQYGIITDREQLIQGYEDQGYARDDAETQAKITVARVGKTSDPEAKGLRNQVYAAYKVGAISKDDARARALQTYGDAANEPATARNVDTALSRIDISLQVDLVKRAIAALRQDYLEGAITLGEAQEQLTQMGIDPSRIQQYLSSWAIDLTRPRRVESSSKVIDWYKRGLVSGDEAAQRLRRLGWAEPEVFLQIASADQDLAKARAAEQVRQARTQEQRAKAMHAAADHARTHRQWAVQELMRHSSPTQMRQWWAKGLIDEGDIRGRLNAMEWPGQDIDRWVEQWRPA